MHDQSHDHHDQCDHHDHHHHELYSEDGIEPVVFSLKQHLDADEIRADELFAVCYTAVRILVQIANEKDWLIGHFKLHIDAGDGRQAFISAADAHHITETYTSTWQVPGKAEKGYEVGFTAIAFGTSEHDLSATMKGIFSGLLPLRCHRQPKKISPCNEGA